jgi:hypothetical protein
VNDGYGRVRNLFRCGRLDVLMGFERVCRYGEMDPFVTSIGCHWMSLDVID